MKEKYNLPKGYKVKEVWKVSPMHSDFFLICTVGDSGRAFVHFDGIEEMPTRIETYYKS